MCALRLSKQKYKQKYSNTGVYKYKIQIQNVVHKVCSEQQSKQWKRALSPLSQRSSTSKPLLKLFVNKYKRTKIRKQTRMKSIEVQMTKRTLLAKKCVDNQRLSQRKTSLLNIRCGNMLVLWKSLTVFRYKGRILNVTAKHRELCFLICIIYYVANANM